ncbi:MAG: hypothetical protein P8H56_09340 [Crocinitomicaceae bacterium]|nr:hypothetical protein [Crocinitomicaceae bacterium]
MKRLLLSFAFLALSTGTFAQAPQGINYQAVIRDGVGVTLNNTNVGMKISIIQTSPGGTVVYEESFATTTSQYGLVNVVVGQGTVISGNFSLIDWAVGPYFVEVAADENGGTSYTTMGTQQLMSVPYALYAENSGTAGPAGPQGPAGNDGIDGIDGPAGPQGPAGTNGTSGTNGVSVNWLGTFTTAPVSPAINDGYYNSTVGISYIWNGAWNIIAQDGASSSGSGSNPNTLIYTVDGF